MQLSVDNFLCLVMSWVMWLCIVYVVGYLSNSIKKGSSWEGLVAYTAKKVLQFIEGLKDRCSVYRIPSRGILRWACWVQSVLYPVYLMSALYNPFTVRSCRWCILFEFFGYSFVCVCSPSHACHIPRQPNPSVFFPQTAFNEQYTLCRNVLFLLYRNCW
jgi:hypothetical protein